MAASKGVWREVAEGAVLAGLAFGVRWLLDPFLGPLQPFAPGFVAVTVSGWFVGWRGGVATALLSYLWGSYFFMEPRGEFNALTRSTAASLFTNLVSSGLIILVTHRARVAERRLAAANEEFRRGDRQKNDFLAALSHELRNPVGVLLNVTEVLDQPDPPSDHIRRLTAIARRQVLHMKRLLDDLLDIGRITRGRLTMRKERADVRQCVTDAVAATQFGFAQKQQQVQLELPPNPVELEHDVVRITQVLVILLDNACKYSPPGAEVTIRLLADGEATIVVSDTGPGVDPKVAEGIFRGVGHATSPVTGSQGLGIGLPLAKSLVELHHGTLRLAPEGGKGATFVITLPRISPPAIETPVVELPPVTAAR